MPQVRLPHAPEARGERLDLPYVRLERRFPLPRRGLAPMKLGWCFDGAAPGEGGEGR